MFLKIDFLIVSIYNGGIKILNKFNMVKKASMAELVDSGGLMIYFRKDAVGSNPTGCKYKRTSKFFLF